MKDSRNRQIGAKVVFFLCLVLSVAMPGPGHAATFVVDSANDNVNSGDSNPGDGVCEDSQAGTRCTLRAAIEESNANGVFDTIEFALPFVINVSNSAFPNIVEALVIDGRSTPGYNGTATEIGDALPVVWLNGSALAGIPSADGLRNSNTVLHVFALGIVNFPDKGIDIDTASLSGSIDRCWVGVDSTGVAAPNGVGIEASGDQVFVGNNMWDSDSDLGNLISGNSGHGVSLLLCGRCEVSNNIIGADEDAFQALPNGGSGVRITGEIDSVVGGPDEGNQILFNSGWGVELLTGDNDVIGNFIGANGAGGVSVNGAGNRIGLPFSANVFLGNRIQNNPGGGILLGNSLAADSVEVRNNDITNNNGNGIYLQNGTGGLIDDNEVWGNNGNGIRIDDNDNTVSFNIVGFIDIQAQTPQGNAGNGVVVNADNVTISNNQIGGATGATLEGIDVWSGNGSAISDNSIGVTDALNAIANEAPGIRVDPSVTNLVITGNTIGYSFDGIRIEGDGVRVCGNEIGSDAFNDFGNVSEGVRILGNFNVIGWEDDGCEGNTIGDNFSDGIQVEGDSNIISDNLIGHNGQWPMNELVFGNNNGGLLLTVGAANNLIANNVMGSNGTAGARVADSAGLENNFEGNIMLRNGSTMGVDLNIDGPTPNDPGDPDVGPNLLQNTPEILSVNAIGKLMIEVEYRVDSLNANATYPIRVEFYVAWQAERQGREFSTTDIYNQAPGSSRTIQFPYNATVFSNLTAMATDSAGNSSEFALPMLVEPFSGDSIFNDGFESSP